MRVVGTLLLIEDITDRVRLEEQLQISEKMASIGLLAAGVAHEVNTPLTGISSFTQMLLEGADPADPKTVLLEKIERQTFRAAKIVNGLLNLSRPGTASNERIDVDLNAVITDVFSLLEHQFEVGSIKVRRELAPTPVPVLGIEHQLQQVFLNLFLNARDAMPSGGWLSVVDARRWRSGRSPRSPTPGRAFRPSSWRASTIRSSRPRRSAAAPASACRSPTASCASTTARFAATARSDRARGSRWRCRWRRARPARAARRAN